MSLYVIADLHLSFDASVDKPMDIYGEEWINHDEKLKSNWEKLIVSSDTVLLPGDISWGLRPAEAVADLDWIQALPGKKIMIKGNHDLWWASTQKLNKQYETISFLQNQFYEAEGYAICGTRGWLCPGNEEFTQSDEKIYKRELLRLEMSLSQAKEAGRNNIIAMVHFPPTNDKLQPSGFTDLFEKYNVKKVFYGHLHGKDGFNRGLKGILNGVEYFLTSFDYLKGVPKQII